MKLERRAVERQAVVVAGDPERLAEAPGAGAEEALLLEPAPGAHRLEPLRRLERANEHRARDAFLLADEVEAPVDAVRAVHVRVTGRAEHRLVPRRTPAEAVRGGVLLVVGLDLDDDTADAVHEERRPDELGCHLVHAPCEKGALDHVSAALAS